MLPDGVCRRSLPAPDDAKIRCLACRIRRPSHRSGVRRDAGETLAAGSVKVGAAVCKTFASDCAPGRVEKAFRYQRVQQVSIKSKAAMYPFPEPGTSLLLAGSLRT